MAYNPMTFGQPPLSAHSFGAPSMPSMPGFATPGGGTTGAPLPGNPAPTPMPPTPQVGMVPGVPGSMGLASGQMPMNPGGPLMTPGGGTTGAPLQGPGGDPRSSIVQSIMSRFGSPLSVNPNPGGGRFDASGYRDAIQQYLANRPTIAPGTSPADRRTEMQNYRQTRPMPSAY